MFCSYPFDSFFLETNGTVKFCCGSSIVLGNVSEKPLKEILQSETSKDIRETVLRGEWHTNCHQCKFLEEASGTSQRLATAHEHDDVRKNIISSESFVLGTMDIRWNNTCNLACVYCDSKFSSKWAKAKGELVKHHEGTEESVLAFVEQNVSDIRRIMLLGGEPLLQKPNIKLLEILEETTAEIIVLSNLSVDLQTNKIAQKLFTMNNVKWCVSFESVGKQFEYIRNGADWNKFEQNLNYLWSKTNRKINIHPTYNLFSSLSLREFYDYIMSAPMFLAVEWAYLNRPQELDIKNQPDYVRQEALKQLEYCIKTYPRNAETLIKIKETLETSSPSISEEQVSEWIDTMEKTLRKPITYNEIFFCEHTNNN